MINFDYRTDLITGIVAPFYHPETLNLFGGFFTQKTRFIIEPEVNGSIFMSDTSQIPIAKISRFDIINKGLEVVAYLNKGTNLYQSLRDAFSISPESFCFGTTSQQQKISVDPSRKQVLTFAISGIDLIRIPAQPSAPASFV